jgi:hypothetical protein
MRNISAVMGVKEPMTSIFRKLAVALVTFTMGVSVTVIYRLYSLPDVVLPEVAKVDQRSSCFPGLSVRVDRSSAQTEFFPAELSGDVSSRRFISWYSSQLEAMNELPLAALFNEDESYRFLWLRSFHQPVAIHVWRTGAQHFMVVKRLNGHGGYAPGTVDFYSVRSLSENDWDSFMLHLEHSQYWSMPTEDDRMWNDGAQWIMEGYREGRYHVVDRQSPDAGAYREACMYLLRRSGLLAEIPANEIY